MFKKTVLSILFCWVLFFTTFMVWSISSDLLTEKNSTANVCGVLIIALATFGIPIYYTIFKSIWRGDL